MRSSSSSSEGLPHVIGLNWEGSVESNEVNTRAQKSHWFWSQILFWHCKITVHFLRQDSDQCKKSSSRRVTKGHHSKGKSRHGGSDAAHSSGTGNCGMRSYVGSPPSYTGPKACLRFLSFWFISSPLILCVCVCVCARARVRVAVYSWLFWVLDQP